MDGRVIEARNDWGRTVIARYNGSHWLVVLVEPGGCAYIAPAGSLKCWRHVK